MDKDVRDVAVSLLDLVQRAHARLQLDKALCLCRALEGLSREAAGLLGPRADVFVVRVAAMVEALEAHLAQSSAG